MNLAYDQVLIYRTIEVSITRVKTTYETSLIFLFFSWATTKNNNNKLRYLMSSNFSEASYCCLEAITSFVLEHLYFLLAI